MAEVGRDVAATGGHMAVGGGDVAVRGSVVFLTPTIPKISYITGTFGGGTGLVRYLDSTP